MQPYFKAGLKEEYLSGRPCWIWSWLQGWVHTHHAWTLSSWPPRTGHAVCVDHISPRGLHSVPHSTKEQILKNCEKNLNLPPFFRVVWNALRYEFICFSINKNIIFTQKTWTWYGTHWDIYKYVDKSTLHSKYYPFQTFQNWLIFIVFFENFLWQLSLP